MPGHRDDPRVRQQRAVVAQATRRRFDPNVQHKRYWVPSLGRNVRLTVSPRGMKTIDKREIDAVVADMLARRERI